MYIHVGRGSAHDNIKTLYGVQRRTSRSAGQQVLFVFIAAGQSSSGQNDVFLGSMHVGLTSTNFAAPPPHCPPLRPLTPLECCSLSLLQHANRRWGFFEHRFAGKCGRDYSGSSSSCCGVASRRLYTLVHHKYTVNAANCYTPCSRVSAVVQICCGSFYSRPAHHTLQGTCPTSYIAACVRAHRLLSTSLVSKLHPASPVF